MMWWQYVVIGLGSVFGATCMIWVALYISRKENKDGDNKCN